MHTQVPARSVGKLRSEHRTVRASLLPAVLGAILCAAAAVLIPAAAQAQMCIPPPNDLVAWWPGDGNAIDIVGANDGTVVGTAYEPGMVSDAFSFDGGDDFVSTPARTFGPALTIAAWINRGSTGSFDTIFGVCDDPNSACTGLDYKVAELTVNNDGVIQGV